MNYTEVACHKWTTEVVSSSEEEEEYQQKSNPKDFLIVWQVEEQGWLRLLEMDPQLQDDIIDSFKPRDTSRGVDALLGSFMTTREDKYKTRKGTIEAVTKYYKMSNRKKKRKRQKHSRSLIKSWTPPTVQDTHGLLQGEAGRP